MEILYMIGGIALKCAAIAVMLFLIIVFGNIIFAFIAINMIVYRCRKNAKNWLGPR